MKDQQIFPLQLVFQFSFFFFAAIGRCRYELSATTPWKMATAKTRAFSAQTAAAREEN